MNTELITRAWNKLAPKLITFLATGLSASALIAGVNWVADLLGQEWSISATLATMLVGGISSVAAFIKRDNLLSLAPAQFAYKVVAFIVTSASAATVVAFAEQLGVDLSEWSGLIGAGLTILATLVGYYKKDQVPAAAEEDAAPLF